MEPPRGRQSPEAHIPPNYDRPLAQRIPSLRIVVGLGDPECERELLPALIELGEITVEQRCLSADQLLDCVRREHPDACLLAEGLHRLTPVVLADLDRARIPLVLLTSNFGDARWQDFARQILPLEADHTTVHQALLAATRGERPGPSKRAMHTAAEGPVAREAELSSPALSVLTVASGPGSPGRTTIALNLAAALGAVAPTVLVDLDLSGPSVAAHIDADPTRNLYMLSHDEPETDGEWSRALDQETQRF